MVLYPSAPQRAAAFLAKSALVHVLIFSTSAGSRICLAQRWGGIQNSASDGLNFIAGTESGDSSVEEMVRGGIFVNYTDGDDYIQLLAGADEHVFGGKGNDRLVKATGGGRFFHGGTGNDTIIGGNLDDFFLAGDEDNDYINTRSGDDGYIFGNAGSDVIKLQDGDDFAVFGGPGNDEIFAGEGNDRNINGGPGDDIIWGGPGNDRIAGNEGQDKLIPGPGDDMFGDNSTGDVDTIVFGSFDGHDTALAFRSKRGRAFDSFGIQPNKDIIVIPCNASVSLKPVAGGTMMYIDNTTIMMQQVVDVTLDNFTFRSPHGCEPQFPSVVEAEIETPLLSGTHSSAVFIRSVIWGCLMVVTTIVLEVV